MLWIPLLLCLEASPFLSDWTVEIAFQAPDKLGACAVGDVDPAHEGPEIVAVSVTGDVYVLHRTKSGWSGRSVFRCPGEMIQCAVGDARPDREGLEIVVCGMAFGPETGEGPGAAWCLFRVGEKDWKAEHLANDSALLHAICVSDGSVFTAGYGQRLLKIDWTGSEWKKAIVLEELPGAAKNAIPTAKGIALACTEGDVLEVQGKDDVYAAKSVHRREGARGRIGTDGQRFVAADDDGTFTLIEGGEGRVLYRSPAKLRGAVLADLVPEANGLEAATVGYDHKLIVFREGSFEWNEHTVAQDTDALHHLVAADLDEFPGKELVACGYSGRILIVTRR
ncbi:MAG: hypothetical protein RL885_16055 [Planctomycetota bacterium]